MWDPLELTEEPYDLEKNAAVFNEANAWLESG